jgi:multidrug efflux pump subunit AcrA (membrane-fusion protein)
MKRNLKLAIILLFSALAGGAGLASCSMLNRDSGDRIKLSGNIELTQVNIAFKVPGRLAELPIEEGKEVRKGALLGRLDAAQLQQQRARDAASLALAETQLVQQKTSIEYQRAALAADVDVRQAALNQADARLEQLLAGSRKQEIEQARTLVEEARTQHALAEEDWTRAQTLYKNDDISTAQRDLFRSRFDTTAATLRRAEEQLGLVVEGPRKEDITAARAQVEQARLQAALARRQVIPQFQLQAQYQQQGSPGGWFTPPTASVGLSVPLPILYQQQGQIGVADAAIAAAEATVAKVEAQVVSDVSAAYASYQASRRSAQRAEQRLLPRSQDSRNLVQIQYAKGAASLLDFLDAQRTHLGNEIDYLTSLGAFWSAVFQLEQAVGASYLP